jgi:hypothetical protein
MRQPIRMKVCLLNAGADEKKEGAHDGKQETPAHLGRTMLCHLSHLYRRLYAILVAILRQPPKSGAKRSMRYFRLLRVACVLIPQADGVRITLFMQNLAAF